MPTVCGIQFRGTGKIYDFGAPSGDELQINDHVIVDTARGLEMGRVVVTQHEISQDEIVGDLKPILRRANPSDLMESQRYQAKEEDAVAKCREQVTRYGLPMKITSAEYSFDGSRLTFYFTAEQRVDFRELVRELARAFRTRIELRQIGVRDEARMLGGLGKCGRPLCCKTWLSDFCPISIRMAKAQDLSLSPLEISGVCGRLLCCLRYEFDHYKAVKKQFPKVGKYADTPLGTARVVKVSALKETATLLFEDGSTVDMTPGQMAGEEPLDVATQDDALSDAQKSTLEQYVKETHEKPSGDANSHTEARDNQSSCSRSRRSRSRGSQKGGNGPKPANAKGNGQGQNHTDGAATSQQSRGTHSSGSGEAKTRPPSSGRRRSSRSRRRSRKPRRQTSAAQQGKPPTQSNT